MNLKLWLGKKIKNKKKSKEALFHKFRFSVTYLLHLQMTDKVQAVHLITHTCLRNDSTIIDNLPLMTFSKKQKSIHLLIK